MFDAVLTGWYFSDGVITGQISNDKKKRFEDGVTVRTSRVNVIAPDADGLLLAHTLNSVYLLR